MSEETGGPDPRAEWVRDALGEDGGGEDGPTGGGASASGDGTASPAEGSPRGQRDNPVEENMSKSGPGRPSGGGRSSGGDGGKERDTTAERPEVPMALPRASLRKAGTESRHTADTTTQDAESIAKPGGYDGLRRWRIVCPAGCGFLFEAATFADDHARGEVHLACPECGGAFSLAPLSAPPNAGVER